MAESSSVTPKWTCLTSQNKALLYLRALLGKHSGQLINTSLVDRSMENILYRATISDFSKWSGKLWVQGRSEGEEREDIRGEGSTWAWRGFLAGSSVEQAAFGSVTQIVATPEAWAGTQHKSWPCRVSGYSSTTELPGLWQGSAGKQCTAQPAFPSQHIQQNTELLPKCQIENPQFNWTQFYNTFELTQIISSHQPRSRFDWSQGQSCFIFWMGCSHQSCPGWIASSQAVLFLPELGKQLLKFTFVFLHKQQ